MRCKNTPGCYMNMDVVLRTRAFVLSCLLNGIIHAIHSIKMPVRWVSMCFSAPLQWRHNERDCVSNHRRLDCLFNRLFRRESKKTSKLRVTDLCEGNSPVTGEFPAQRSRNEENASIWWRHHAVRRRIAQLCPAHIDHNHLACVQRWLIETSEGMYKVGKMHSWKKMLYFIKKKIYFLCPGFKCMSMNYGYCLNWLFHRSLSIRFCLNNLIWGKPCTRLWQALSVLTQVELQTILCIRLLVCAFLYLTLFRTGRFFVSTLRGYFTGTAAIAVPLSNTVKLHPYCITHVLHLCMKL